MFLPQRRRKGLVKTVEKDWQAKAGAHPNALKIDEIIEEYFKGEAIIVVAINLFRFIGHSQNIIRFDSIL